MFCLDSSLVLLLQFWQEPRHGSIMSAWIMKTPFITVRIKYYWCNLNGLVLVKCGSPSLELLAGSMLTCPSSPSRSMFFAYHSMLLPEGIYSSKFVLQYRSSIENMRGHMCLDLVLIALTVDERVTCQYTAA